MEYVALVLFLVQLVAWFVLPAAKRGGLDTAGSLGDEVTPVSNPSVAA